LTQVTSDQQAAKELELRRLRDGKNPIQNEGELRERVAVLEADLVGLTPILF
jgi:hypothetical protein